MKKYFKFVFIAIPLALTFIVLIGGLKQPLNTYFKRTLSSPTIEFAPPTLCQNEAIRQLVPRVVQLEVEGDGIVRVAQLDEHSDIPETYLAAAGLSSGHIKTLKAIADYATKDRGVLGQTFQTLTDKEKRGKLLLCSLDQNCRFKDPTTGAGHTPYSLYQNTGQLQVRQLQNFPYFSDDPEGLKAHLTQEETQIRSNAAFWSAAPSGYAVVTLGFRNLAQRYPEGLQKFFRPYDDLLHELVHFADHQLFREWVLANETLKSKGKPPSQLYQDHTLVLNGITYLSWDFFSVFTEIRAWVLIASLTLQRMQHTGSSEADIDLFSRVIERTFLHGYFNSEAVKRAFKEKHGITEENIFEHVNTFRDDMLQTIEQAKKHP